MGNQNDSNGNWRLKALCTQFPTMWADRMWLYEDSANDAKPDPVLRTTARRVCAECPVRAHCLAAATVNSEQHGIHGGFRLRERKVAPDPVLRTTARRVCAECPVRAHCLAAATVNSEQHGIHGGFRLRERKVAAELAERDGVHVYSRTGTRRLERFLAYVAWILEHEEIWTEVPRLDHASTRRKKRATDKKPRLKKLQRPHEASAAALSPFSVTGNDGACALTQDTLF